MGLGGSRMPDYKLAQLAQSTGMSYPQIQSIYHLYRHYSVPLLGLTRGGYIRMYSAMNPQYAAYAPEIADRAFYGFDTNRNGRLNFYEFLISYQMTTGSPQGALQTAQVYSPLSQPNMLQYPEASRYTTFLHRFLAPQAQVQPQQMWTQMNPVGNSVPVSYWYNYILYYSIYSNYLQQPYQSWPQYVPVKIREEIYPLPPTPVAVETIPTRVKVREEIYPLVQQAAPQPQSVVFRTAPPIMVKVHEDIYPCPPPAPPPQPIPCIPCIPCPPPPPLPEPEPEPELEPMPEPMPVPDPCTCIPPPSRIVVTSTCGPSSGRRRYFDC